MTESSNENDLRGMVESANDISSKRENEGFKRQINLLGAIGLLVGTIIGSGIFVSPSEVAKHSGSTGLLLIVWIGSGILALFSALCYVELGTMFPTSSGSDFDFVYEAFGELPAFMSGFISVVVLSPMAFVMVTLTCGNYIASAAKVDQEYSKLIAAIIIGIIFVLNCTSVRLGTFVQEVFTAVKLSAVIMIAVTGIVKLAQGHYQNFREPFKDSRTSISEICFAFYGGSWAYGGYSNLPSIAAELKNPIRDLPLAMWFGMIVVTVSYVTVNAAYLTLMTPLEIATSSAVGVTFGDRVYGPVALIIPVMVACSSFGASNGGMIASSRMLNAIARKGHVPKFLSLIHNTRHTPSTSLLFICIVSWVMLIPKASNFGTLLKYVSFINSAITGATVLALLWLRYKRPEIERPFKVFIGLPILVLVSSAYFTVAPFYDFPLQSTYCLAAMLVTIPIYFVFVKYKKIPQCLSDGLDKFALMLQKINMDFPPEEVNRKEYSIIADIEEEDIVHPNNEELTINSSIHNGVIEKKEDLDGVR